VDTAVRVAVAVLSCLPALAAVPAMPRLVGSFGPAGGEQPRRDVPGTTTFALLTAAVAGSLGYALREHLSWLPAYLYLGVLAVVLAAVDARVHRLPERLVLPSYPMLAALFGVAALVDFDDADRWVRGVLAGAVVWLVFVALHLLALRLPPHGGLGRGDVTLSGLLGGALGWLGWPQVVLGFVAGVLFSGVWALLLVVTRRAGRHDTIAYGPHLLAGAWAAVLLAAG
jgi:leader peptidase (prepilin peptidase)/N-methyltransferase